MSVPPNDLALVRLALVAFSPRLADRWKDWALNIDGTEVVFAVAQESEHQTEILVQAAVPLKYPPKGSGGEVFLPEKERVVAERAIEFAANLVAVGQGRRRHISSPWPPAVLVSAGDAGRRWLATQTSLRRGRLKREIRTKDTIDLPETVLQQLGDRADGLSLMVEALGQRSAMGRFREFVRLFERAFRCPPKRLADPVAAFLHSRFGYDRSELVGWFETMRDPATHADARNEFLLEADVRPVTDRMEQAAYDVLVNKASWRSPDAERRERWCPTSGSFNANGGMFIQQHTTPTTDGLLLDEWGVWPMALAHGVFKTRPSHWWPQVDPRSSDSEGFEIRIVAERDLR
ncbi:hypothetical protein C8N24_2844 [Solirubrobacter pauli]|uniref:Uncharacterized protein n=1 Tax=Solirubrobacter pauli TaxID=166793 RepID=A0A660LD61_9ACTN|nr:hypothetical protein [Solirubrobacter pauli]RKQ92987.1 hypothetical protein C8N24_2844 [Solirubrobacter pauli]